jgi:hypothetical protein
MEPIEVSPNLTCNMISIEPLPRIIDTNIVYIGEDTFNSNTTKKDDTPKNKLETVAMHVGREGEQRH